MMQKTPKGGQTGLLPTNEIEYIDEEQSPLQMALARKRQKLLADRDAKINGNGPEAVGGAYV